MNEKQKYISSTKQIAKTNTKKDNAKDKKKDKRNIKKIKYNNGDDDNIFFVDDDDDDDSDNKSDSDNDDNDNENENLDEETQEDIGKMTTKEQKKIQEQLQYRKFLKQLFPSKYITNKIENTEKLINSKKTANKISNDKKKGDGNGKENGKGNRNENKKQQLINNKIKNSKASKTHSKTKVIENIDDDEEQEDDDEYSDETYDDDESDDNQSDEDESDEDEDEDDEDDNGEKDVENDKKLGNRENYNIILTIENGDEEFEDCSDWEDYDDSETENEDDSVSSCSTSSKDSQSDDVDDIKKNTNSNNKKGKDNEKRERKTKSKINTNKEVSNETSITTNDDNEPNHEVITLLQNILQNQPNLTESNRELLEGCIEECKEKIIKQTEKLEKKLKKQKQRNSKIYKKIVRDKNTLNDHKYFSKLDVPNQKKIIKEMRKVNEISRTEKPYRIILLESDIPPQFKSHALKKISNLKYMDPGSGEYYKIKQWVDNFMKIPFNTYKNLDINIDNGVDACSQFLENAYKTLNECVYGLNDAKMQIMQMVGQLITNPKSIGTSIAICGPYGTGKTSLIREGVSKILNRPFAFIALGGATDSSFLEGHSYTYEGSIWGKIVQVILDSKCMNPVIYFDEVDKISETLKGEEIMNILIHLTDVTQNDEFHDKYFSEITFDLSKCLFIFSYNDEAKINPILLDRMYKIKTTGYSSKEKMCIAYDYLLPKIRENIKFSKEDIVIPENVMLYIIDNYTCNEKGVRNTKRCLETIYSKLNLFRLMRTGENLFKKEITLNNISFPLVLTQQIVDLLLKRDEVDLSKSMMYL